MFPASILVNLSSISGCESEGGDLSAPDLDQIFFILSAKVALRQEKNEQLRAACEEVDLEASALRARMLVAREETEEAKKALKELIDRLGNFTPAVFKVRVQRIRLNFSVKFSCGFT